MGGINLFRPGSINLMPGKPEKAPADTATSVRVRVAPAGTPVAVPMLPGGPGVGAAKTISLTLQAAPEPKLRWQQLLSVQIDKAIDDNDQKLTQHKPPMPMGGGVGGFPGGGVVIIRGGLGGPWGGFNGGMYAQSNDGVNYNFPVTLDAGAKESKKLKELTGTIAARFLAEAKSVIEVKDVMKAKGKTFKGGKDGELTINSVEKAADGTIQITFDFQAPTDVQPETQQNVPGGIMPVGPMPVIRPGIRILPALPPAAVPAPAVKPDARPAEKKPEKKEDKKDEK